MKLLNSVRLVSLVSAVLFAGCQDTDYDFEKNYLSADAKAFVEAFEERYGYIDPDHTFNDAFYGSVEVTTDQSALVTISAFIDSEKDATILAQAVVDGTQTIEYDYPNGTARVFVIAKCNDMTDGAILSPGKGGKASFAFGGTRAQSTTTPTVQTTATLVKYVTGFYTTENGSQVQDYSYYSSNHEIYKIDEWTGRFYTTSTPGDLTGDYAKSSTSSEILSAIADFCESKENSTYFNDAAQNISFQVTADGPISLTGVSCTTNSPNTIGYFFTTGDHNTLADFKAADKFILIPNTAAGSITGNKYYLTYYPSKDSNGNPTGGTHIIPEGTIVHFFLIRRDGQQPYYDNNELHLYGDLMWGSEPAITKITAEAYNVDHSWGPFLTDLATTASFTYNGFMCLGFEDWPQSEMRDWNDCVFTLDGNITNGENTETKKLNVFTLAVEDLGVADDQDYNDVVFTVSQQYNVNEDENGNKTVSYEYPELEFLCAGGTLPLRIYYKNDDESETTLVEEVHKGFGLSSTSIMINTAGSSTYANYDSDSESTSTIVRKDPFSVTLKNDYFLSNPLQMSKHADKFYIEITKKDGSKLKVNANSNDEADSHTPFVLVIPTDSWEFPKERENIDLVYSGFKAWVNSQEGGRFWYDENSKEVQEMEEDLMDGASTTISVETTSTSTVDQKYGDNDLATTLAISPSNPTMTSPFVNWNFLRQTDNLTYTMLLDIEDNSKAVLDIETVWGSKDYGTLTLLTLGGQSVTAGSVETSANNVKFKNVPVANILKGFKIHNTNSDIKLQSMVLTIRYKDAESYKLEADGVYTYTPVPELFYHTQNNTSEQQLGYKINFTCGEGVRYVKIETEWAESIYNSVSITSLNGQEVLRSGSYSNNYKTVTFDKVDLSALNVTTGFILTGFTDKAKDLLSSVKITVLEEENTGGDDNQGGSDDNQTSGSVLSIGSNSVAPVEEGMYSIWGNYYAYKFTVTIPSNTKSIKLISDWTDTDNYQDVLTVNTDAGADVKATKTWVDGKIHAVINYEINAWLYNYKVSENTYSFLLTHFSQTSTLVNKTITIELIE
jgi:hypothetical protein